MKKKMAKAIAFLLFLMTITLSGGARDVPVPVPVKDEVYSPQGLLGPWGLPFFGLPPLPFLKPPWLGLGGCCGGPFPFPFPFPFLGTPKAGAPLNNKPTKADGNGNGNVIDPSP
ncbi:hypothetical protein V6N13_100102 [Hibiscus sabdariffa]|uniref:Uncharacterized protein n=2 Tax=Hibiscus sabdariffa TaxID=183260 RepID=A0ABR2APC7_9ROSI